MHLCPLSHREVGSDEIVVDDDVEEGARDLMELPYRSLE